MKNEAGDVVEVRCTPRSGDARLRPRGRASALDGTIHWVSAEHAVDVEVRLYDRLFSVENPGEGERDFRDDLNPRSLEVLRAKAEPSLGRARAGDRVQFERVGYFYADRDSKDGASVWNRVVPLKDSWAKVVKKADAGTKAAVFEARTQGSETPSRRSLGEGSGEGRALARSEGARRDATACRTKARGSSPRSRCSRPFSSRRSERRAGASLRNPSRNCS